MSEVPANLVACGYYEPHLTLVKLPRCPKCLTKHPLAYSPPRDASTCPECGGPAAEAEQPIEVDATFAGEAP